jgi:putative alpha-1,2-mannosidase
MRKHLTIIFLILTCLFVNAQEKDLLKYVNTLVGTESSYELSYGNTYPATALPYGMHTWSPANRKKMATAGSINTRHIVFGGSSRHINVVPG